MIKNDRIAIQIILNLSLLIVTGGLLVSCNLNRSLPSQASENEKAIESDRDPFDAIFKLLQSGKDYSYSNIEDDSNREAAIAPVSLKKLIEYFPQPPVGWTAEKPQGQTNTFGSYSVSQVKQSYFHKDKAITISIFDWAFNSALYAPFLLSTEFSQESTEGYNKGIKIGDIPGRESYDYASKNGSLNLLINRRFFIQIDGDNIEENELREWWNRLDSHSLSKLK